MAVYTFNNVSVFVISEAGAFVPVSANESVSVDTSDFDGGEWARFRNSDGMVNRLEGNLELWETGEDSNWFEPTSMKLWYDLHGAPSSLAGTYVVVGLRYYSAQQPDIEITVDDSIASDGYVAVMAEYGTLDVDREVFWAFSDFNPVGPEPTNFWTSFIGAREVI